MFRLIKYCFAVAMLLGTLFSCKNNAPVDNNRYILWRNDFKGNQNVIDEELEQIIPFSQKENSKPLELPITPRVWWYNFGQNTFNPIKNERKLSDLVAELEQIKKSNNASARKIQKIEKKIERFQGNLQEQSGWLWRNIGEKQVLISAANVAETASKMKKFLYDVGYRDAEVIYRLDSSNAKRKLKVTYFIDEKVGYKIDTVQYVTNDVVIDSLIKANVSKQTITSGSLFDLRLVAAEKLRLEALLKNNGYYNFNNKFISHGATNYENDEALFLKTKRGNLKIEVQNPENKPRHERFTVEEVIFKAFDPNSSDTYRSPDTVFYNGVKFIRLDRNVPINIISPRIISKPGSVYRISDIMETQRQISLYNQFAFTSSQIKPLSPGQLSLEYFAPLLEKYTFGISPGINNIYNDGSTFFGLGVPVSLTARNLLKKLEIFEGSLRASYEGQPAPINTSSETSGAIRGSLELGLNLNLTLPTLWPLQNSLQALNLKNPRTIFGIGYNYSEPFWGKRLNFKLNTNHSIQFSKNAFLYLSVLDAHLINTIYFNNESGRRFYNSLIDLQQQGNNLKITFDPQFVSSLNSNFVYNNQNPSKPLSSSKFFRLFLESGGTVLNFLDNKERINIIEKAFPLRQSENGIDSVRAYFRFVKLNADYRRSVGINAKSSYAYRFNVGLANPYGSNRSMPFDKNFFIGGSNSVRAWAPRTLGTGSSKPDITGAGNTIPQPGDILLESSIEYRLKVLHFAGDIQLAGFVDAGNVWKWHQTNTPSKLDKANFDFRRFYKEIAIGTGFGLRWDLSYFLFRFDWGIKVFDPSQDKGSRFVLDDFSLRRKQQYGLNWNFGIGYPF
ncbi:translocation and assembly module lipoprotein TamL [Lacihabitans soyangensis]|nr:BamA/TamA family outer membrane protein [Lacihabitans soyangensis]